MRPQWDNQILQLATAIEQMRSVMPVLPATFTTAQGLVAPTDSVLLTLEELKSYIQAVNDSADIDPLLLGIHQNGVLSPIPNIASYANSLTTSPNPTLIDQIAQQTWGIRASLVWLNPKRHGIEQMDSAIAKVDLDARSELLKRLTDEYRESTKQLKQDAAAGRQMLDAISVASEQIKTFERESSAARNSVEASATAATTNKEAITTQLAKLSEGIDQQARLLESIEVLKEQAVSTLESSSKVALAASFALRKDTLAKQQLLWQRAFAAGIGFLIGLGVLSTAGWMKLPPVLINNQIELGPVLTRLALIGPAIWFTWFAVRSLGTTNRLIEDYAFKEASALAFVGYQREMQDDVEMIKLLRESAIHNFGNQPTRVFEKVDPSSPIHEALVKAMDSGGIDKVIELLKAIRPSK